MTADGQEPGTRLGEEGTGWGRRRDRSDFGGQKAEEETETGVAAVAVSVK